MSWSDFVCLGVGLGIAAWLIWPAWREQRDAVEAAGQVLPLPWWEEALARAECHRCGHIRGDVDRCRTCGARTRCDYCGRLPWQLCDIDGCSRCPAREDRDDHDLYDGDYDNGVGQL